MMRLFSFGKLLMWVLWSLLTMLVSLFLAWKISGFFHFYYATAYELLNIELTIELYAPQNRFRHYFPITDSEAHKKLFIAISDAIQAGGQGLGSIEYQGTNGIRYALLHNAEITHLKDVAMLVSFLQKTGWLCLVLWVVTTVAIFRLWKLVMPPVWKLVSGSLAFILIATVIVLLVNPVKLFYVLHVKLFPPDHQWFFYYQDSLMTTIMKAPDLFGFIALALLALTGILFVLILVSVKRIEKAPVST